MVDCTSESARPEARSCRRRKNSFCRAVTDVRRQEFLDEPSRSQRDHFLCTAELINCCTIETGPGAGERQDAEGLRLLADQADGPPVSKRIQTAADAEANARARSIWRQIHERLPKRISRELVQESQTLERSTSRVAELLSGERVTTAFGVAQERLDLS